MEPVFARAASIVAEIHHSHGIKAALSVKHLHIRFPHWTDEFWQTALTRALWFDQPVVAHAVAVPDRAMTPKRAQVLLARAVVPLVYSATRSWTAAAGADKIIDFYTGQAAASPGYLGHRLSILLAFGEAWPIYADGPHRNLYLDRLVEFILACRFSDADGVGAPSLVASWEEASSAALIRPGFFGHHLICLAWIGRNRQRLSEHQLHSGLGWVLGTAEKTYEDPEDNVTISGTFSVKQELMDSDLEVALRALLLEGVKNIHLLTLADAIAWLWDDLDQEARPALVNIARHCLAGHAP